MQDSTRRNELEALLMRHIRNQVEVPSGERLDGKDTVPETAQALLELWKTLGYRVDSS